MDDPNAENHDSGQGISSEQAVRLLDGIPGAYERAKLGLDQATTGETIPLADMTV